MSSIILIANSVADVRGQAPPVIPIDDGVSRYDYYQDVPLLNPVMAGGMDPFRADALPHKNAEFPIAFTVRGMSSDASQWADHLSGDHGEIARQTGTPTGTQETFGGAYRAVVRPVPNAWDSGYWTQ